MRIERHELARERKKKEIEQEVQGGADESGREQYIIEMKARSEITKEGETAMKVALKDTSELVTINSDVRDCQDKAEVSSKRGKAAKEHHDDTGADGHTSPR